MTRRTTSDDERKLFEQTFKEGGRSKPALPKKTVKKKPPQTGPSGVNGATQERLRRGMLEPDARIDLHGMTQTAAHRTLFAGWRRRTKNGHRLVLVITGKGNPKTARTRPG